MLLGYGNGDFEAMWPNKSGLVVGGDAKALTSTDFNQDGRADFLITRNDNTAIVFESDSGNQANENQSLSVRLIGTIKNPTAIGAKIFIVRADESRQSAEIHAGSGYLSQSAPVAFFASPANNPVVEIIVRWPDGQHSTHDPGNEPVQVIRRQ